MAQNYVHLTSRNLHMLRYLYAKIVNFFIFQIQRSSVQEVKKPDTESCYRQNVSKLTKNVFSLTCSLFNGQYDYCSQKKQEKLGYVRKFISRNCHYILQVLRICFMGIKELNKH